MYSDDGATAPLTATRSIATAVSIVLALSVTTPPAAAQGARSLSLDDAVRIALAQSPSVALPAAAHKRTTGLLQQARSETQPQVGATLGYTKTLLSQFSGLSFGSGEPVVNLTPSLCAPRIPDTATPAERNAAIAQAITCPESGGGGFDFSSTGFGASHQWAFGLQFSQNLYTGGRIQAQIAAAQSQERSAAIDVAAARAQVAFDVTQAYFDAILADQLVGISDSSLVQADEILRQTQRAREAGSQSEFDLLRAQVTRDNLVPVSIQAKSGREIAYLHLKTLLDIPLGESLQLATALPTDANVASIATSEFFRPSAAPDTVVAHRAPVRQLEEAVIAQEAMRDVVRSERRPSLSLVSGYQHLYFPSSPIPNIMDPRQNLTVGLSSTFSLFNGGRTRGAELVAEANVEAARHQLKLVRDMAALDTRIALSNVQQAEASWRASQGTVEQARRAYDIDQIRYREGISTQTDLAQSRLLIEQATANRARAARDLAVARMRLQLLNDLPLSTQGGSSGGSSQQPPTQPQQSPTQATGGQSGPPRGGSTIQ